MPIAGSTSQDNEIAAGMRGAIVRFVMNGDPNESGSSGGDVRIPAWKNDGQGEVVDWSSDGTKIVRPVADNQRCEWWLKGLWAPQEEAEKISVL